MHSLRFMRCRPCGRRPAASGRRGPLRLHSKAPHGSPSLRPSSRYALRSMPPMGRHHCALRSRRRAPANGSGDVAVSPDARLPPRVGAATLESSSGSLSRSPRLCRDSDTLRPAAGMPGSTLYVQSHLGRAAERRWQGNRSRDCPCAACDTIACGDASPPGQHLPFRRYSHGRKHHQRNVQRVASGNRNHRPSAGEEGVSGERGFWHKRSRGPLQSNPALN